MANKKALYPSGGETVWTPHGGRHHQQPQGEAQVSITNHYILLLYYNYHYYYYYLLSFNELLSQAHISHTVHGVPEGKRRGRGLCNPMGRAPGVR